MNEFNIIEETLFKNNNLKTTNENFANYFPDIVSYNNIISIDWLLNDINEIKGAKEFAEKIINYPRDKKICVIGDYDVDGILGTVILISVLRNIGFTNVSFYIPDRLNIGYGMTDEIFEIENIISADLIITVDNGITSKKYVDKLIEIGKDVIITDHHLPEEGTTPENVLIINPKFNNDSYQSSSGAIVVFKAVYELMKFYPQNDFKIDSLIAFAGITVISDLMAMLGENRKFVKLAFSIIDFMKSEYKKDGKIGLRSPFFPIYQLVRNFGGYKFLNNEDSCTEELISYQIAPCINSISRVEGDVSNVVEDIIGTFENKFFKSYASVGILRKQNAQLLMNSIEDKTPELVKINILNQNDFEFKIKGLLSIASNKFITSGSTVALTGIENNGVYELSGRSTSNYNLYQGLKRIAEKNPELEIDLGGHSNALGVRVINDIACIESLKTLLEEDIHNNIESVDTKECFEFDPSMKFIIDGTVQKYSPYGAEFKPLKFHYIGTLEGYDSENKIAIIDGMPFRKRLNESEIEIGRNIEVYFDIRFNSFQPIYNCVKE